MTAPPDDMPRMLADAEQGQRRQNVGPTPIAKATLLLELAAKATPGRREIDLCRGDDPAPYVRFNADELNPQELRDSTVLTEGDASFIAACDPQTVTAICTALLDAVREQAPAQAARAG